MLFLSSYLPDRNSMAVDASQVLLNREMRNLVEGVNVGNFYSSIPMGGYGNNMVQGPLSGTTTTATDGLIPMYDAMADSVMAKTFIKSESGLTNYAVPISWKRPRGGETVVNNQQFMSFPVPSIQNYQNGNQRSSFTFLGEDLSGHVQQEQSEIDRFIAQNAQKVRMEIEEKRKSNSRRILAAVENVIVKKLRAKEEQIEKISKVNLALEERLRSLFVENQIWRELAQTHESTANALRSNLEQIIAQVQQDDQQRYHQQNAAADLTDDAQSSCGSNCFDVAADSRAGYGGGEIMNRLCRNCWKKEANVLIMPCRHLCLCSDCGPVLLNCPVCNSVKEIMVRVNVSSS